MANSAGSGGLAGGLADIGGVISNVNVASGFGAPAAAPGRAHANPEDAGDPVEVDAKALDASVRSLRRRARAEGWC